MPNNLRHSSECHLPPMSRPGPPPSSSAMPLQPSMYWPPVPQIRLPQPGPSVKAEDRQLSYNGTNGKYKYSLVVEQQPQRARMCGFGDKDRRPITPPPCVRLLITDAKTGEKANFDDIEGSFFVLQVDLWDENATREVNIVRTSSTSPAVSISTATTTSFPPTPERPIINHYGQPVSIYHNSEGQPYYGPAAPSAAYPGTYPQTSAQYSPPAQAASSSLFTRNLIGSLTVNASRLKDTNKKEGYWFVLQDLSVRTEGHFRLKMNFIDVGTQSGPPGLNRTKCPVLAWVFSEKFQVFSAKKFPGVIESTSLSKAFAGQGIKIPIRKEGKPDKNDDDDDDE